MTDKLKLTVLEPGTVQPDEYDWETYFAFLLNGHREEFVTIDAGKVRGLALSYVGLLDDITELAAQRGDLMRSVGLLLVENQQLKDTVNGIPPTFEIGNEVIVKATNEAAFIQFIEPGTDNIWIRLNETHEPLLKHSKDIKHL